MKVLSSNYDKSPLFRLLTPPATPLFPSLEMEAQKATATQNYRPNAHPTALRQRVSIIVNPGLDD